jgi:glycosyltransferase 2 family protein
MNISFRSGPASIDSWAEGASRAGIIRRLGLVTFLTLAAVVFVGGLLNGFGPGLLRNVTLGRVRWSMLIFALLTHLASLGLEAWQLRRLGEMIGHRTRFGVMLRIYLIGNLFANITPSAIGGEPVQLYSLSKERYSLAEGSFLLTVRGFLSVLARLLLVAALGLAVVPSRSWPKSAAWNIFALLSAVAMVLFLIGMIAILGTERGGRCPVRIAGKFPFLLRLFRCRNEGELMEKWADFAFRLRAIFATMARNRKLDLAQNLFLSTLIWLAAKSVPFFVLTAFGEFPSWPLAVAAGILAQASASWAPTPGAAGAQEAALSAFFLPLVVRGDPAIVIPAVVLVSRFFEVHLNLVLALPAIRRLFKSRPDPSLAVEGAHP